MLLWLVACGAEPSGRVAGRLPPCPASNACVSSEAPAEDREHHIAPFRPPEGYSLPNNALARVRDVVVAMPRASIVGNSPTTLRATFSSAVWGFVDDVEFRVDSRERVVHVRSASRVGWGDWGVNRARVETIRAAWMVGFEPG